MRALSTGSASSPLKIVLDVVYIALSIAAVVVALVLVGVLVVTVNPDIFGSHGRLGSVGDAVSRRPLLLGQALAAALYIAGVLVIVNRLRRIFAALTVGGGYDPLNVRRLRVIGLMLAALEMSRYAAALIAAWIAPQQAKPVAGVSLTAWFAVLVVFVLAEVSHEGARLRGEGGPPP
jgi:hypothetical protein